MTNIKKGLIIIVIIFAAGFAAGHFLFPKTKIVEVKTFEPQTLLCPAAKVEIQKIPVVQIKQNTLVLTQSVVVTEWENEIYNEINSLREQKGLPALKINEKLVEAARAHAKDMVEDGYFAHDAPDGAKFSSWIEATDYKYTYAGENIAKNYKSALLTVEGWAKSEGHYKNIIDENYTETGIGVVGSVAVQMFAKPQ